ncbi:hypothetical protein [Pseudonocardia endophytica]|uniref:Uncharacterized protein n=1 Tax=Pseudonocardia endophytica TaxID=401976 RepID=A0A4R1HPA9_PSEEN|nr:hypothetical protein [Pseudonocardia endophytica]TCK21569.1 hypothetical protein EV378_5557 [Pseudonocardia endophytica]
MTDIPVPPALRVTFGRWVENGRPTQEPVRWRRATWEKQFSANVLVHREPYISRPDVAHYAGSIETDDDAVRAFIASMIWGYGTVGYGAYRTRKILEENPGADARLLEVARLARTGDWGAAFTAASDPGLTYLGVAFGTKYLYFCSLAAGVDTAIAPVLDGVVAQWLAMNTSFQPTTSGWNLADYRRYVELMHGWADELSGAADQIPVRADDVEQLIFDSEWEPPETLQSPRAEITSLLARLRLLVGELESDSTEEWEPHIDELRRLLDEEGPADDAG